jgi:hypothetical protein
MDEIKSPLKPNQTGADVGDLQTALQHLIDRGVILKDDDAARKKLIAALQKEHDKQTYGPATSELVNLLQ